MVTLHKAIKPAGLVDGAQTFSLFLSDSGLYCIKTGPAARELKEVRVKGIINEILAKLIFNKIEERFAKKVAAGEARINTANLDGHAREKGSSFFPKSTISDVAVDSNKLGYPRLTFSAEGKRHEFYFRAAPAAEVQDLAAKLQ